MGSQFRAIRPETGQADIEEALAERWDCVAIGGGFRIPLSNLELFEMVANMVARFAAGTAHALDTSPGYSPDALNRGRGDRRAEACSSMNGRRSSLWWLIGVRQHNPAH